MANSAGKAEPEQAFNRHALADQPLSLRSGPQCLPRVESNLARKFSYSGAFWRIGICWAALIPNSGRFSKTNLRSERFTLRFKSKIQNPKSKISPLSGRKFLYFP